MPVGRKLWRGVRLAKRVAHLATRGAVTAGGLGAAQGPQKLWGIWCKILHSSNLETPYFSLKKFHLFIAHFIISHKMFIEDIFFTFEKKNEINLSNYLPDSCFQGIFSMKYFDLRWQYAREDKNSNQFFEKWMKMVHSEPIFLPISCWFLPQIVCNFYLQSSDLRDVG